MRAPSPALCLALLACAPPPGATKGAPALPGDTAPPADSGEAVDSAAPTGALPAERAVAAGAWAACLPTGDGRATCAVDPVAALAWSPEAQAALAGPWDGRDLDLGVGVFCWVDPAGEAACLGPDWTEAALPPGPWDAVEVGYGAVCLASEEGAVACTGLPGDVAAFGTFEGAVALDVGPRDVAVVTNEGAVVSTGSHGLGRAAEPGDPFVDVAVGGTYACGLHASGALSCWGDDVHGQATPPAGGPWVQVEAGSVHTCARDAAGAVSCWGSDAYGQLAASGARGDHLALGWGAVVVADDGGGGTFGAAADGAWDGEAPLSYAAHIQPIFDLYCVGCHNGYETGRLNLLADVGWAFVTGEAWRPLVVPGDLRASTLWARVAGEGGGPMPPGRPLPQPLLDRIERWILEGAAP